jgi:hypothetical protein
MAPVPGSTLEVLLMPGTGGAAVGGSTSGVTTGGASGAVVLAYGVGPGAGERAGLVGTVAFPSWAGGAST